MTQYNRKCKKADMPNWVFRLFLLICLFFSLDNYSQITLQLEATEETCTSNACISFQTFADGSSISAAYTIYRLPDMSNPVTTSSNSYCGLSAGQYQVVGSGTHQGTPFSVDAQIEILADVEELAYSILTLPEGCGATASLWVIATAGTPTQYEILSGPELRPLQTSNVFTGLTAGTYQIRVFDPCGHALVQTHTFSTVTAGLSHIGNPIVLPSDCEMAGWGQSVVASTYLAYPLQVSYSIHMPNGDPIVANYTLNSGPSSTIQVISDVSVPIGATYPYEVTVSDSCGNTVTLSGEATPAEMGAQIVLSETSCAGNAYEVIGAQTAEITQAPLLFPQELPYALTLGENGKFPTGILTPGDYVFTVTVCENEITLPLTVVPMGSGPLISVQKGCEVGKASLFIRAQQGTSSAVLMEAPDSFVGDLPMNLTVVSEAVRLGDIPAGEYTFAVTNSCGYAELVTVDVEGYAYQNSTTLIPNCGSFALDMQFVDNNNSSPDFWLQKWDPTTQQWCQPGTGIPMQEGDPVGAANAYPLINNTVNINLAFTGHFRVVVGGWVYTPDAAQANCSLPIMEFDFEPAPVIDAIYSVSCDDLRFEVFVQATGAEPLQYAITTKNGAPFVVENGTNSQFPNLDPGVYEFQVTDACQNVTNQIFDTSQPVPFVVSQLGGCEGEAYTLSVPAFPFAEYAWYQQGNNSVLSSSHQLVFPTFSNQNLGEYYVEITGANAQSCLDRTLTASVGNIIPIPNAGADQQAVYCWDNLPISLEELLTNEAQLNGIWTLDETPVGNSFEPSEPGIYTIRYTVSSECNASDWAEFTLVIHPEILAPQILSEGDFCEDQNTRWVIAAEEGMTYEWTGPNGFSSNQTELSWSNPTLEQAGLYTVFGIKDGCVSATSEIELIAVVSPEIILEQQCGAQGKTLFATVSGEDEYQIVWSGPDGFTSAENPTLISGRNPGMYTCALLRTGSCPITQTIEVTSTQCGIPKGVSPNGDGQNDTWDLSGLGDNLYVKIFNRYGMCVYEKARYVSEWDGRDKNGNRLPSATYYYVVTSDQGESKTGWVYLLDN